MKQQPHGAGILFFGPLIGLVLWALLLALVF